MPTGRNNEPKTAGAGRFKPGNPGRPKGSRHKATLAAEALLDGDAAKLTRKAVEMALAGDAGAMRLRLERILPPRKDRLIRFELPAVASAQDHPAAIAALLTATAAGELAPAEAQAMTAMLAEHGKALNLATVEERLTALEADIRR